MEKKFDAYQMVTDKIVALMENGVIPWAIPWNPANGGANCAWSRGTGKEYSFLNQMMLADPDKEYSSLHELLADVRGEYLTFKQAQELGGHVKKGEHGKQIVFFKMIDVKDGDKTDDNGDQLMKKIPCLKSYTVFRVDQCEGIEQKYHNEPEQVNDIGEDLDSEELISSYVAGSGVTLNHVRGNEAYYSPMLDTVVLPLREQFKSLPEYYSTAFHELAHSTGHEGRLNRLEKVAAFGNEVYSTEELTAEICSASILATLGIDTDASLRNSAAYVQNWLKALKNDKKMIVVAAARAEKALQMIFSFLKREDKPTQEEKAAPANSSREEEYSIYQLKNDDSTASIRFMGMSYLNRMGITPDLGNYEKLYTGSVALKDSIPAMLEDIYTRFNTERPEDFSGHSLSVSDVVSLVIDSAEHFYYVDSFGFKELTFAKTEAKAASEAPELLEELKINHPDGCMHFRDLKHFFPMTQKDFKVVLPLLKYLPAETLRRFACTLKFHLFMAQEENALPSTIKRLTANISAIAAAYPEAVAE